ncbi:MAG: NAD(P)-dependent oxidoreductase [Clostridiales bacterium]|jgi:nucleoside-diphosphate-sugar epimerase|nr:NAD(P)-dependent oxidoreductase [Clostridiales bacterium]
MKKRILLTGAAGNVGYRTLLKLLERGDEYEVTAFDLPTKKSRKLLDKHKNKIKIVYGGINDEKVVDNAVEGQDVVIHLAAMLPPVADRKPDLAKTVNFLGTQNLVRAIKEHNPDCFIIYSSSISVYGDRTKDYNIRVGDPLRVSEGDYYALTKVVTEKMLGESGVNYTIFRFSAIMGLPHTDPLMFHMPLNTRLEIASSDTTALALVNACQKTAELNGRTFNLGGGESCRVTYKEFLTRMLDIYGLNIKHFKPKAFAEKNFHCGYYADTDVLNDILDFQHETLEEYYEYVKKNTPKGLRVLTKIFSAAIAAALCNKSEPYIAKKKKLVPLINRFFN